MEITAKEITAKACFSRWVGRLRRYRVLYLMLLPGVIYYVIFRFMPMYGVTLAFTLRAALSAAPGQLPRSNILSCLWIHPILELL